ncbi:MAG: 3-isopropylmalate dehydratase large subunit [Novosphingobium sp.]|uniref:3-isopropylmalate dehydratase large subunit n=1 Tax=Novosphingobium sp. TaxID=1874826 RepID=UPI002734A499|nr:3-isopropylmalate dehydratase large subunit [Novosphingobium sp.]MDP3550466.1 3-isopropylmalate dehydratase large subunit [Novosphingobium sp.]
MSGLTLFDKLWDAHSVRSLDTQTALIAIDRILLHERTGGIAMKALAEDGRAVRDPARVFVTMDHVVDTLPGRGDRTIMPTGTQFITQTREAALAAGVTLFDLGDPRQGIVHVISPENAIVLPGLTLVCPDSHTCTQGALGALAWGIGSSEAEHALATNTLRVKRPATMRITVTGLLPDAATAKDLALHIVATIGSAGARGHVVEYAGPAIAALSVEERMTLCNMATELAAFTALIAPDEKVFAYFKGRSYAPGASQWDDAVAHWRCLVSDPDAQFDREIAIDAGNVAPMISWGTSPEQSIRLDQPVPATLAGPAGHAAARSHAYMGVDAGSPLIGLPIDAAFIGSCTNARLSDLRKAAAILQGRTVAPGLRAICVPGSSRVKAEAEAEGLDQIFRDAGFEWREAGCSMCFFAGGESFGAGERVISTTNRNFESRQGHGTRTHLASPETVAASAVAGHIVDPRGYR